MNPEDRSELGDDLRGAGLGDSRDAAGPVKGQFVPPPETPSVEAVEEALPDEQEFWRPPARFGSVPVEATPLGWDSRRGFQKLFPRIMLPTQVVERVSFGDQRLQPNRLFWGDNLHVMRQLPSESVDLIYIDPPFFSGRHYNVLFGDQNELRSFADIWEDGLPGYLIWLNARLYEMKRLLKKTGLIYVHLDWHASHYVKQEMDKIFGHRNMRNEIIWYYNSGARKKADFGRRHDTLLRYSKTDAYYFNDDAQSVREPYSPDINIPQCKAHYYDPRGKVADDVWRIPIIPQNDRTERIGYPTQKPERLLVRVIESSCPADGIVADLFCGGGTTPAVSQRLGRRWIACDQSRVAVAITADRIAKLVEQLPLEQASIASSVPDFTIEHWGIYEVKRLSAAPADQFRQFVLRAYGAVPDDSQPGIHGHKGAVPLWVGDPSQKSQVTGQSVVDFANAVRRTIRYRQDNLRDGTMLAWAFRADATQAAQQLRELEATDLDFVRLDMVRIDSPEFREHISALSTSRADYSSFLTFILPPRVEVGWKKLTGLTYRLDVSETVVLNPGGRIINVQWDFNYTGTFVSTQGYSFIRTAAKEAALIVDYTFPSAGEFRIACKVQDDIGGEGLWTGIIQAR